MPNYYLWGFGIVFEDFVIDTLFLGYVFTKELDVLF
jgi:hypothetical protein